MKPDRVSTTEGVHPASSPWAPRRGQWSIWLSCLMVVLLAMPSGGCSSTRYLTTRDTRENALAGTLKLLSRQGPQVRQRTALLLRRYGLEERYRQDPAATLATLRTVARDEQDSDRQFAVAELAYIEGKRAERKKQVAAALENYAVALISSYEYLFSTKFAETRSPYDPSFRGACDLYNEALEDTLRLLCAENQLRPGQNYTISAGDRSFTIETAVRGNWSVEDFDHFEFVSDYQVQTLNNRHQTFGLGVPLIAVRRQKPDSSVVESRPVDKYYPDGLSFPVTALLRPIPHPSATGNGRVGGSVASSSAGPSAPHSVLEFFDPLTQNQIYLADHWVPLQTDLTTPLAYFLDTPQFRARNMATEGLLNPNKQQDAKGLFMLEPYDPERIPVVMVHGLWSSPLTWMDMFNDLRSFPEIRERYQFWFYLYPTGQPFWISATQMRRDLAAARETFDPRREHAMMDQMVLVGHSMGGLVSRMQTIHSGDDFWKIVTDRPARDLRGDPEDVNKLVSTLKFQPNQSITRVITIATPHRGSDFSNKYTQWLGRAFIELPRFAVLTGNRLVRANPDYFKNTDLLTTTTSIDGLAPESPIFPVMLRARRSPNVKYHNIVGLIDRHSWVGKVTPEQSDGVVTYASARVEDVESEITVTADHTSIHTRPESILEVRRILMEHLADLDARDRVATHNQSSDADRQWVQPASATDEEYVDGYGFGDELNVPEVLVK